MFKKLKAIKKEIFYIRKAREMKRASKYLFNKYIIARRILKRRGILEKSINNQDLSIHVLTCHKDLIMLVWSLASFYKVSNVIGKLFIHNDGSLTLKDKETIKKFFPSAVIIDPEKFLEKYSNKLKKYPVIEKFRLENYSFWLKKIIDPHFVSDKKYHLIIDSDILWFGNLKEIEEEINSKGKKSFMMHGKNKCPVYLKDGTALNGGLSLFNAGLVFCLKDNLNMEKLSELFNKIDRRKSIVFMEQFGYAYSLENLVALSEKRYSLKEKIDDKTIAFHYTGPLRHKFYIEGIELILNK